MDIKEFGELLYALWAEIVAALFLIIGFIVAAVARSAFISYVLVFFCGLIAGRVLYIIRDNLKFPFFIISLGFAIGFMFGSFYADKRIIFVSYLIGIILSFYIHKEEYVNW